MNRRTFLASSIALANGLRSGLASSNANPPCPPPSLALDGAEVVTTCSGAVLAVEALLVGKGNYRDVPALNNPIGHNLDIQWGTTYGFYDPIRKVLQYMGKPASSQDGHHRHYVYDELSNTWYKTMDQVLIDIFGHIWSAAFDYSTGDYWMHKYNDNKLHRFDYAAWLQNGRPGNGTSGPHWKSTATESRLNSLSVTNANGLAVHPNLFGPGAKGIVVGRANWILGYHVAGNAWYSLSRDFYGESGVFAQDTGGAGIYLPGSDTAIVGGGNNGVRGRFWNIPAGASVGSRSDAQDIKESPPVPIWGPGGTTTGGKLIQDPNDASALLILELASAARVWRSIDAGRSWSLRPYSHPFMTMGGGWSWTAASISGYGIIWGLSSSGSPRTRLWRPAD